ncbi:MAG: Rhs family protein [Solirubrobacterales bacterium]|nr:Rhs family protein [Solirubrobacterales bacterium]
MLRYTTTGLVSVYAGGASRLYSGDGGPAVQATLTQIGNLAVDGGGNLLIGGNETLRKVNASAPHVITRIAGNTQNCNSPSFNGTYASVGATATEVSVSVQGVAVDPLSGDYYVGDVCTGRILRIVSGVIVAMYAGRSSSQMTFDPAGNLYFADHYSQVRRLSRTGVMTTVAGTGVAGYSGDGGPATQAQLKQVAGLAVDPQGNVYLTDIQTYTDVVRKVDTNGIITTIAGAYWNGAWLYGDGGPASDAHFYQARDLALDAWGDLMIIDSQNRRVRMIIAPDDGSSVDGSSIITSFASSVGPGVEGEDNADNPAENCAQVCDDDSVNTATGQYAESQSDISVPGRGVALDFTRSYGSLSAGVNGPLGYGWTSPYAMSLSFDSISNNVIIRQENGSQLIFYPNGSGGFTSPTRELATLVSNADGSYTLTRRARSQFVFDASGRLIKQLDLNGYATTLAYDGSGRLLTITDPAGRALTLAYDASNRVTSVADQTGRQVTYGYSGAGDLTTVTDVRARQWAYAYDANHRMLTRTDPNGHTDVTNTYDASGRVLTQADGLGRKRVFVYQTGMTQTTSPAGNVTRDYYSSGALWKQVKASGTPQAATITYAYDTTTLGTTSTTDPNGHVSTATFDSKGNQLTSTDPLGHKTSMTYDALNDQTSKTDPNNVKTTLTYDTRGNLLTRQTPLVGTTQAETWTYTYGDAAHPGDVTAGQDPVGKVTNNVYDAAGDLTSVTNAAGDQTTYGYDSIGQRTSMVSPRGNAAGAPPADYTTSYAYDAAGHKTAQTDPLGHQTSWTYDAAGNVAATTDPNNHTTSYAYDAADQQTQITRPDNTVLKSDYDPDGNLSAQTDAANHTTSYTYDPLNRQASVTDPLNRTTSYGYDKAGNRTTTTDPKGRVTTNGYDNANRLTSITYSDGATPGVTVGYDADDQRTSMADGSGQSSWTWDSLHRVTQHVNGNGVTVSYSYDLAGHKTAITYPGNHTATYTYDDAGRMASLTDWLSRTTNFSFNRDSQPAATTFPTTTGDTDSYTYNRADQQTATDMTQGSSSLAGLSYTRDNAGLLTAQTNTGLPGNTADSYAYTPLDQLSTHNSDTYAYDNADNPTTLASAGPNSFDAANQLTATPTASFTYDELGQRITATPTGGAATYYSYDQAGRLTGVTPPTGSATTYGYDGRGTRMSNTTGTTTTRYTWDAVGALPLLIGDAQTSYLYGPNQLPVEQIDHVGTPTYYHHDQLGSTRMLTDASGSATASFTFDPFGQRVGHTGTQNAALGYAGEYTNPETGFQYLRARYYDPTTAVFVTRDPLTRETREPYVYVDSNPLNGTDPTGLRGECGVNGAGCEHPPRAYPARRTCRNVGALLPNSCRSQIHLGRCLNPVGGGLVEVPLRWSFIGLLLDCAWNNRRP